MNSSVHTLSRPVGLLRLTFIDEIISFLFEGAVHIRMLWWLAISSMRARTSQDVIWGRIVVKCSS